MCNLQITNLWENLKQWNGIFNYSNRIYSGNFAFIIILKVKSLFLYTQWSIFRSLCLYTATFCFHLLQEYKWFYDFCLKFFIMAFFLLLIRICVCVCMHVWVYWQTNWFYFQWRYFKINAVLARGIGHQYKKYQ